MLCNIVIHLDPRFTFYLPTAYQQRLDFEQPLRCVLEMRAGKLCARYWHGDTIRSKPASSTAPFIEYEMHDLSARQTKSGIEQFSVPSSVCFWA